MSKLCNLLAAILLTSSAGEVIAQVLPIAQTEVVQAGRTLSGPGTIKNLPAGEQILLFFFQRVAKAGLDICATVVNTGEGTVRLDVFGDNSGSLSVRPGATEVLCRSNVDNGAATCHKAGSPCSFLWRVEEADSSSRL